MDVNRVKLTDEELFYGLSKIDGLGRRTLDALLANVSQPSEIITLNEAELMRCSRRVTQAMAQAVRDIRVNQSALAADIDELRSEGIDFIWATDERYPSDLNRCSDAPFLMTYRGDLHALTFEGVAIVGATLPTAESEEVAYRLGEHMATCGFNVVSGLARGVDTHAHLGALSAGGMTTAVMGGGLRRLFPPENLQLAERINISGLLLSEAQVDAPASGRRLMARNRIIAGLSKATFVVQAAADSGSLETGRRALRYGRLLYVLNADFEGNRELIERGALPFGPDSDRWGALEQTIRNYVIPVPPKQLNFDFHNERAEDSGR